MNIVLPVIVLLRRDTDQDLALLGAQDLTTEALLLRGITKLVSMIEKTRLLWASRECLQRRAPSRARH